MDRRALKGALEEKARSLEADIAGLRATGLEKSETEAVSELSSYDNHPADMGSETFEREKDLGLQGTAEDLLEAVRAALDRMERGTYGRCVACGRPIGEGRLAAEPWAERCIDCQGAAGAVDIHSRPVEEEVLSPPFGRSFRDDDARGTVGFDGEDAWQAVARVGTSNTPSDTPPAVGYDETYVGAGERIGAVEEEEETATEDEAPARDGEKERERKSWSSSQPPP